MIRSLIVVSTLLAGTGAVYAQESGGAEARDRQQGVYEYFYLNEGAPAPAFDERGTMYYEGRAATERPSPEVTDPESRESINSRSDHDRGRF